MIGSLLYLTLCSAKNRLIARIKRIRNPRYAIGLVVGLAYLYLMLFRRSHRAVAPVSVLAMLASIRSPVEVLGGTLLFLIVALSWLWPGSGQPALSFTRAEVQFLFTAPITRRQLVGFAILRSQLGAMAGGALVTLFFRQGSASSGWAFFTGISLIMGILNLHFTGVSLSRESLSRHGLAGLARQWFPLAVVTGAVLALIVTVAHDWSVLSTFETGRQGLSEIERLGTHGVLGIVLWPFRALVALPLADSAPAFLRALVPALAILALNVAWVMRTDVAFEEASAERAEKVARTRGRRLAAQPRAVATPFALSLSGRVETAIVWKNLVLLGRYVSLKALFPLLPILVGMVVGFSRAASRGGLWRVIGPAFVVFAAFTAILGPQMMRNDLRQDLARLAVLKTWPVRGATIVRGEVLAPAVVLTVIAWLFIACAAPLSGHSVFGESLAAWGPRLSYATAALLVLPGIILIQLLVQNGIAVMFPAWVSIGPTRAQGVDAMGQRLFTLAGILVVLAVAVVPAGIVAALVIWAERAVIHRTFVVPPAAAAAAVLFAEAFLAAEILGRVLDRTDVSALEPSD